MNNKGNWFLHLFFLTLGLIIAHLGVSLFLVSALGSDPFTVFVQGLARTFSVSVGTMHVITLTFLVLLMIITTKGYIKTGTFICAFLGGPIIDFFLWLFNGKISIASPLWIRFLVMVIGCIILSFGMALVIASNAGTGPNDLVAIILTDKIRRFQFRTIRISCDIFFTTLGFLFGGTIGVGTVIAALLVGPSVQFFLPIHKKHLQKFKAYSTLS